jgi:TonB family protein
MQAERPNPPPTANASVVKRRTAIALFAFVAISTALHFTVGPEVTKLSPHWVAANVPDQALSIVTLSRRPEQHIPPPPTPTPSPVPLPRTKRDLALLKYREIGAGIHLRPDVHPPAHRKSTIVIDRAASPQPNDKSRDADVVAAMPEPTPQASQAPGAARADTGGKQDDLSGSIVWGDDNPPRLLRRAPLGIDDHASGTARIEVQVSPDGQVTSIKLVQSSGDAAVDQAALDASRSCVFAPATLNGMPVHGSYVLEYAPNAQTI